MFSEFRSVYSTGSLISELLTVEHGKYIVRALVVVDGVTLSTGMAAAETLEAAEDRARIRALDVLGIQVEMPVPAQTHSASEFQPQKEFSPDLLEPVTTSPLTNKTLEFPEQARLSVAPDLSPPISDDWLREPDDASSWEENALEATPAPVPSFELPEIGLPPSQTELGESQFQSGGVTPATREEVKPPQPAVLETKTAAASEPVDLSEAIAKISVEIKRLGWGSERGKSHLMQTYGKASSKLLEEWELLDFLHYLESQPTP